MNYSGGNKRKLSAALSMLEGNKIIFLDGFFFFFILKKFFFYRTIYWYGSL